MFIYNRFEIQRKRRIDFLVTVARERKFRKQKRDPCRTWVHLYTIKKRTVFVYGALKFENDHLFFIVFNQSWVARNSAEQRLKSSCNIIYTYIQVWASQIKFRKRLNRLTIIPTYPIDWNRRSENQSISRYQSIKLVYWYRSIYIHTKTVQRLLSIGATNRPFPSSGLPHLQSESKCEVFVMKISFHSYVK